MTTNHRHRHDGPHASDLAARPTAVSELPVVAELPELGELLEALDDADRAVARAVTLLAKLQAGGVIEAATGLPPDLWLAQGARRTHADRRMLTTAAELSTRLPATFAAFRAGRISWSQIRAIVLACVRLPAPVCTVVDDAIASHLPRLADADPDALTALVSQAVASLEPDREARTVEHAEQDRFVHLQPRLDGTGGRLYGNLDGAGFALVADALDPGPSDTPATPLGSDPDPDTARQRHTTRGRRRADRLVELCASALTGQPAPPAASTATGPPPVAPKVLLSLSLEQLLGLSDAPAQILTTVTGGRMRMSTAAARAWIDTCGARFRGIVIQDSGEVLGVGRARYRAPGWLRDALLVRDATCTAPLCRTSARLAQTDHTRDWHRGGRTDVANLGWLHQACHTRKSEWQVHSDREGTRTWTHPRTGLTYQHVPTARRLPLTDPATGGHGPPDDLPDHPGPPHGVPNPAHPPDEPSGDRSSTRRDRNRPPPDDDLPF